MKEQFIFQLNLALNFHFEAWPAKNPQ